MLDSNSGHNWRSCDTSMRALATRSERTRTASSSAGVHACTRWKVEPPCWPCLCRTASSALTRRRSDTVHWCTSATRSTLPVVVAPPLSPAPLPCAPPPVAETHTDWMLAATPRSVLRSCTAAASWACILPPSMRTDAARLWRSTKSPMRASPWCNRMHGHMHTDTNTHARGRETVTHTHHARAAREQRTYIREGPAVHELVQEPPAVPQLWHDARPLHRGLRGKHRRRHCRLPLRLLFRQRILQAHTTTMSTTTTRIAPRAAPTNPLLSGLCQRRSQLRRGGSPALLQGKHSPCSPPKLRCFGHRSRLECPSQPSQLGT